MRGEYLLLHTVRGLLRSGCVDRVLVVAGAPEQSDACKRVLAPLGDTVPPVVAGSVRATLAHNAAGCVAPSDVVLVHDPACPFTPGTVVRAVVEAVRDGAPIAMPSEPVTDTIKAVGPGDVVLGTVDRTRLASVQSPQGYRAGSLLHDDEPATDVRLVPGDPRGRRLATPFDVTVMEALLTAEETA